MLFGTLIKIHPKYFQSKFHGEVLTKTNHMRKTTKILVSNILIILRYWLESGN